MSAYARIQILPKTFAEMAIRSHTQPEPSGGLIHLTIEHGDGTFVISATPAVIREILDRCRYEIALWEDLLVAADALALANVSRGAKTPAEEAL